MSDEAKSKSAPTVIKKYANRRLYNTATSTYVTLDHLAQMVKDGIDFIVLDAKTGEDITRPVLTQIIVEEESKGQNLLPINFLRQLIGFYGDSLQSLVPRYLDYSMGQFSNNQDQMRRYLRDAFGGLFPFGKFEEMGKQNMALFENAMKMFMPFQAGGMGPGAETDRPEERRAAKPGGETGSLDDLKAKLAAMQQQIDDLARKKRGE